MSRSIRESVFTKMALKLKKITNKYIETNFFILQELLQDTEEGGQPEAVERAESGGTRQDSERRPGGHIPSGRYALALLIESKRLAWTLGSVPKNQLKILFRDNRLLRSKNMYQMKIRLKTNIWSNAF